MENYPNNVIRDDLLLVRRGSEYDAPVQSIELPRAGHEQPVSLHEIARDVLLRTWRDVLGDFGTDLEQVLTVEIRDPFVLVDVFEPCDAEDVLYCV
jgi:hypothetical protein